MNHFSSIHAKRLRWGRLFAQNGRSIGTHENDADDGDGRWFPTGVKSEDVIAEALELGETLEEAAEPPEYSDI